MEEDIFLSQQYSYVLTIILFVMGFRIVGMEMLAVIQCFQLILQSQGVISFHISYNIHGYNDYKYYPFGFQLSSNGFSLFKHFNFMLLLILIVFVSGIFLRIFGEITKLKQDKVGSIYATKQEKNPKNSQKQKLNISMVQTQKSQIIKSQLQGLVQQEFAVHFKKRKKKENNFNEIENNSSLFRQNQEIKDSQQNCLIKLGNIFIFQIVFSLSINCFLIFTYSFFRQISQNSLTHNMYFEKLFTIVFYFLVITVLLILLISRNRNNIAFYGENQLKFKTNIKSFLYWLVILVEKIIYAALLTKRPSYLLYLMLGIKFLFMVFFIASDLYFKKHQKIRCVFIHSLHFLILIVYICNKQFLKDSQTNSQLSPFYIEIIYSCILGLIILTSVGFYGREIMFGFKADFRQKSTLVLQTDSTNEVEQKNSLNQIKCQKGQDKIAIFDQKSQMFSDNQNIQSKQKQERLKKDQEDTNFSIFINNKIKPIEESIQKSHKQIATLASIQNLNLMNSSESFKFQKKSNNQHNIFQSPITSKFTSKNDISIHSNHDSKSKMLYSNMSLKQNDKELTANTLQTYNIKKKGFKSQARISRNALKNMKRIDKQHKDRISLLDRIQKITENSHEQDQKLTGIFSIKLYENQNISPNMETFQENASPTFKETDNKGQQHQSKEP